MPFLVLWRHSELIYLRVLKNLLHVAFIVLISHYGKFTALYKLISIALQLTNQIK